MSGLSRGTRIVLLASLVLNVALVVALLIAAPWSRDDNRGRRGPPFPAMFDPRALKQALPEAKHPMLEAALTAHRDPMRARIGTLFEARGSVRDAILADPFDRAALDAAFERLRIAESATADEAQDMLADVLAQTTAEERKRIAELMARRGEGRHRGRDDGRPEKPGDAPAPPPQR